MLHPWLKATFWGERSAGKTELISRMISPDRPFNTETTPTVGAFFYKKIIDIKNLKIGLHIWDISGDEKYTELLQYSQDADIGIYCVDLSVDLNLEKIALALESLKQNCPNAALFVVGTKADVAPNLGDKVSQLEKICLEKSIKLLTTSAKNHVGIDQLNQALEEASLRIHKKTNLLELDLDSDRAIPPNLMQHPAIEPASSHVLHKTRSSFELEDYMDTSDIHSYSIFEEAKRHLLDTLEEVDNLTRSKIRTQLQHLQTHLFSEDKTIEDKTRELNTFKSNCQQILDNNYSPQMKAAMSVLTAAAVTLLAWLTGFSVGFACGLWTGPGAFITGFVNGSIAATTVVATSTAIGISAGALQAYSLFKTPDEVESVNQFVTKISEQLTIENSSPFA